MMTQSLIGWSLGDLMTVNDMYAERRHRSREQLRLAKESEERPITIPQLKWPTGQLEETT